MNASRRTRPVRPGAGAAPGGPLPLVGRGKGSRAALGIGAAAWVISVGAMGVAHALQPGFDHGREPLSFLVHGRGGAWLTVALAGCAVAAAALTVAWRAVGGRRNRWGERGLAGFAVGLAVAAAFPSDRWFPWEGPSTVGGWLHAAAGVLGPAALAVPIVVWGRESRAWAAVAVVYGVATVGSAVSLGAGLLAGGPPPGIGAWERLVGVVAAVWLGMLARRLRREAGGGGGA